MCHNKVYVLFQFIGADLVSVGFFNRLTLNVRGINKLNSVCANHLQRVTQLDKIAKVATDAFL